jgi:hypothetical protein
MLGDFGGDGATLASTFNSKGFHATHIGSDGSGDGSKLYTAPMAGPYRLEVWGAKGGGNEGIGSVQGGNGGYAAGTVYLDKGDVLHLYVGGAGKSSKGVVDGGSNGGGNNSNYSASNKYYSGTGGGASDIRIGGESLHHRAIVAGGGGGAGNGDFFNNLHFWVGGAGGGLTGMDGKKPDSLSDLQYGRGGSQIGGGSGGKNYSNYKGKFGSGGSGAATSATGGGGGGGWYGGGAGYNHGGGGGGSGWVCTAGAVANWNAHKENNTYDYGPYLVDTEYYLTDTVLVDGSVADGMPNPLYPDFDPLTFNPADKSTWGSEPDAKMTGNPLGGFIRITYLSQ